jgi:spore coat protein I
MSSGGFTMPSKEILETSGELNKLAVEVMSNYNIIPDNISIVQSGTIKTVWKIKSSSKTYCLKRLKQTIDKALFSVNAQIYIKNSGGNVPEIIHDLKNQGIVTHNEQLFVLYEWLPGKDLDFSNPADLRIAIQGLAKFHIKSKGYIPVEGSRVSSKLGKWPEQYKSMADKLLAWKEISKDKLSTPCYASFVKCADSMLDISYLALELLDKSSYIDMTKEGTNYPVLCHQDFGKGNAILTNDGLYVLDLDGVTFDLSARDLRKIIGKRAENKGKLEVKDVNDIIRSYSEVNPLSEKEREVLFIDILYPHWFYGLTKNIFLNNKILKADEIEKIAKLEQSKVSVLIALLK